MTLFRNGCLIVLVSFFFSPANAMWPVVDVGAIAQLAHQLEQMKQQAKDLKLTIKQLEHGQFRWADTDTVLKQLEQLTDQTSTVVGEAGKLDTPFRQLYPGYGSQQNFSESYKNTVSSTLKKLNGVSQALDASRGHFNSENLRLRFLQQQAEHAQGQTQAIQASSQLVSENVSQLQLLRQSVLAQSSAQVSFYATQVQKEASTQAELEKVLKAGTTQLPSYGTSGEVLTVPDFK